MQLALEAFQRCVEQKMDLEQENDDESLELFRPQFAKSYYNIGMIYDKIG